MRHFVPRLFACALAILLPALADSLPPPTDFAALWLRAVLGISAPRSAFSMGQQAVVIVNAPYSAVVTTKSITRFFDGSRITGTTSDRHYRDSKGRTRTEFVAPGTDNITSVFIKDSVTGQYYNLSPQLKSAQVTTIPGFHPDPPQQPPVPAPENGTKSITDAPIMSLGEKDIEGVRSVGTRWEQTFPAGTIDNDKPISVVVEEWYSPDLGIIIAASQHLSTGSQITYQVHNISRNEPDAALFTIPADYAQHEEQITPIPAARKD